MKKNNDYIRDQKIALIALACIVTLLVYCQDPNKLFNSTLDNLVKNKGDNSD